MRLDLRDQTTTCQPDNAHSTPRPPVAERSVPLHFGGGGVGVLYIVGFGGGGVEIAADYRLMSCGSVLGVEWILLSLDHGMVCA